MFDKRLRKLRTDQELSQKTLADMLGISPSTVAMYEQGRRTPDNEMLQKIANYFKVSVDYLLGRTNTLTPPTINEWQPELTQKDEKDIEKSLNRTLEMLENQEGLMLSGELIDEEDFELIKAAIQNGLEYAKKVNKKKYTPKKFRK